MPRLLRFVSIVLVVTLLLTTAVPSMVVHAQEDPPPETCEGAGLFYWPCRLIDALLNGVLNFFTWVFNTINNVFILIGQALEWFFTGIANIVIALVDIVRAIFHIIGEIFRAIVEAVQILGLIVQIVIGLIGALGAWLWNAVTIITGFLTSFFTSAPTALPGVPQCITAPTQHDLCAFWWLGDNTVFSGSIGSVIVTLCLIIIDVSVVFLFVRKVMFLLRSGEKVADVS